MDKDVSALSTKTKVILLVAAIALVAGCSVGGFLLGKNYAEKENVETKEKVDDKKEEKEPTETEVQSEEFKLDSDKKFIITTDSKYMTMQNDGGSNINIYYQVDLEEKVANKLQDKYVGFEGYEYKGHLMNKKELSDDEVLLIQELIDKIIKEKDQVPEDATYQFYTLDTKDYKDIKITNKDYIEEIRDLLE